MTRIILPFAALFSVLCVTSCDDEMDKQPVAQRGLVQFEKSELALSENAQETSISITLDGQATGDGELQIQVSSSNVEMFQFEPAVLDGVIELPFLKGQSKISINVTPIDNDVLDGDKTLDLTILSVTPGYDIGTKSSVATVWIDDESPAKVNFGYLESHARENEDAGYPVTISFSHAAKADGIVTISVQSPDAVYGTHFTTMPAATNGIIRIAVERGASEAVFKVFPLDDELYNAERSISYTIASAEGGLEKGGILQHDFKITDDELDGKGKGYEITGGGWRYKKRYEYNQTGAISKIYWDQYTPGHTGGIYTYVYHATGQLEKIVKSSIREEIFLREGERIVKSEEYTNNVLTKYVLYGYDVAGNVAEAAVHYRQPDGTLVLSTLFVYLYYTDHNVYKVLTYSIPKGSDDKVLTGTKTFDNYIDVENPFPMVDILPGHNAQRKLPTSYRVEENDVDITYHFTYQYTNDCKPQSRTATSPSGSETAVYEYY